MSPGSSACMNAKKSRVSASRRPAACYLMAFLGPLLGLPDWVMDLSPFTHVPLLPAAPFDAVPLLGLTGVAAALVAIGLAGFRRRNVPA